MKHKKINTALFREHCFSHDADIGIIGRGNSFLEAFVNGAEVMFSIMSDQQEITEKQVVEFEFQEKNIELAYVEWLNLLIAYAQKENLVFNKFKLSHLNGHWFGMASGEPWRAELTRGVEVKGATLTALSVKETDGAWEARCVVDV